MVSDEPKLCDFKLYESLKHAGFHYEKLFE